jgi:hypothetical protein
VRAVSARSRHQEARRLEQDVEILAVYQLDLLAQMERQLRAVHHTKRHIEKLRAAKHRVGPELSDVQGHNTLTRLDDEVAELDAPLKLEHACCTEMHTVIAKMQDRVADMRRRSRVSDKPAQDPAQSGSTS